MNEQVKQPRSTIDRWLIVIALAVVTLLALFQIWIVHQAEDQLCRLQVSNYQYSQHHPIPGTPEQTAARARILKNDIAAANRICG